MKSPFFITFWKFDRTAVDADWVEVAERDVRRELETTVSTFDAVAAMDALFEGKTAVLDDAKFHANGMSVPNRSDDAEWEPTPETDADRAFAEMDVNDLLF